MIMVVVVIMTVGAVVVMTVELDSAYKYGLPPPVTRKRV